MFELAGIAKTYHLVHHKLVKDLPDGIWIDEKTGKTVTCRVMAVKAYSHTQAKFWDVDFTIISNAERESCDESTKPI